MNTRFHESCKFVSPLFHHRETGSTQWLYPINGETSIHHGNLAHRSQHLRSLWFMARTPRTWCRCGDARGHTSSRTHAPIAGQIRCQQTAWLGRWGGILRFGAEQRLAVWVAITAREAHYFLNATDTGNSKSQA